MPRFALFTATTIPVQTMEQTGGKLWVLYNILQRNIQIRIQIRSYDGAELQKQTFLFLNKGAILPPMTWPPESQKSRQRVSNADLKVFANPESFCDKFIIG